MSRPKRAATQKGKPKSVKEAVVLEGELVTRDDDGGDDDEHDDIDEGQLVAEVAAEPDIAELTDDSESSRQLVPVKVEAKLVSGDPLHTYMQQIKQYPLLTREAEHELAVRLAETGDAVAARRLVESNLRLVVKIAYEYRRAHLNLLDMIQEGNVGLMQAVSKYDPYRGVKLSTYAAWWIRAYILKFVLNNHRLVKLGTTQAQRKLFFNLKKESERLESLGFSADPAKIAEALDVREKDVVEMQKRLSAPDASFDAPLGGSDTDTVRTRHDVMEGTVGRPDEAVEETQFQTLLKEKLSQFADTLKGREETIFRERWLTDEPVTLQEIGDRYGVSRERARQIEKRMMGRLRTFLEDELGTAVDIGAMTRD